MPPCHGMLGNKPDNIMAALLCDAVG